jgi:hypothetical protein
MTIASTSTDSGLWVVMRADTTASFAFGLQAALYRALHLHREGVPIFALRR